MIEVISLNDEKKWNEVIRSMKNYDFYSLAEYHQLEQSGIPVLLHFQMHSDSLALPVIIREIGGTDYKDISSVYGYSGPLANSSTPDPKSIAGFKNELLSFFDAEHIVTAFSRLHPLFLQEPLFGGLGEVVNVNQTVAIDLSLTELEQKKQYAHSLRNNINRLRKRTDVIVKRAETREEIDSFIDVYRENMERVNAAPRYFFSNEYFVRFLTKIDSTLLVAYYGDEIVSGSLFTECGSIIQSHLSATKNKSRSTSPLKYVWDQIRVYGTEKNMQYLHLGGGVHGKDDSLFAFKSQFSKHYFQFKIWKYIHNEPVYAELLSQKFGKNRPEESFFPLYRLK
jgi:hypothetical protein